MGQQDNEKIKGMKKILILFITFLLSNFIFGQIDELNSAQQMLKERGEVYFKFELSENELEKSDLLVLTNIISIDDTDICNGGKGRLLIPVLRVEGYQILVQGRQTIALKE